MVGKSCFFMGHKDAPEAVMSGVLPICLLKKRSFLIADHRMKCCASL